MKIEIDTRKSLYDNAAIYYEKSKKFKEKIKGLKKAIEKTKKLIELEEKKLEEQKMPEKKILREKEWYEKFHWFFTSNCFLALAGKDAKSNQILVKKHLEKNDLYFHADVHGAPSVVLKKGQEAGEKDLKETAIFTSCFSSAWKTAKTCDAYCVRPEQVKTAAKPGEYLPKGGFVILGKKKFFKNPELRLALTYSDNKLIIAPEEAIKLKTKKYLKIEPVNEKKGESAKKIFKKLLEVFPETRIDLNWVLEILPPGGSKIVA